MTKDEIENVIKRYPHITDAIKQGLPQAIFYVGKRREVIEITDEVKMTCEIIQTVYKTERNPFIRHILKRMLSGETDIRIMHDMPFARNAYYAKKQAIIAKIYGCCIARRLVSYEDVLNEEIAI